MAGSAGNTTNSTRQLIALAQKFADGQQRQQLREVIVDWFAEELGGRKVLWRAVVNQLFRLADLAAGQAAGKAAEAALSQLAERLMRFRFFSRLVEALQRLDVQAAARQQVEQRLREALGNDHNLPATAGLELLQAQYVTNEFARTHEALASLQGTLDGLQDLLRQQAERHDSFRADLLTILPTGASDSPLQRLHYTAGLDEFLGRGREMEVLQRFLTGCAGRKDDFRWMLITAPGGAGKSRLAWELCRRVHDVTQEVSWHAGFLRLADFDSFLESVRGNRQPPVPLLIVLDYVATRPQKVGELLCALAEKAGAGQLAHPLRVLLLERPHMGEWMKRLLPATDAEAAAPRNFHWPAAIDPQAGEIPGMPLPPLDNDDLLRLMHARLRDVPKQAYPADDELLQLVQRMSSRDEQLRPLFALAAAEYLRSRASESAEGEGPEALSHEKVFDFLLRREREKRWLPVARDDTTALERCENLLALATFAGGLQRNDLERLETGELQPVLRLVPDYDGFAAHETILRGMGLKQDRTLLPLEPDILGEHFVLRRLEQLPEGRCQALVNAAWVLGAAGDAAHIFLLRTLADFHARLLDQPLLLAPQPAAGHEAALAFSRAVVDVTALLGRALAEGLPSLRKRLAEKGMDAETLQRLDHKQNAFWQALNAYVQRVAELRQHFDADARIALEEAQALFNAITVAARQAAQATEEEAGRGWSRVDEMLAHLSTRRNQFPDYARIAQVEAQALFNAITVAARQAAQATEEEASRLWTRVEGMLLRLSALHEKFPDDPRIALEEAWGWGAKGGALLKLAGEGRHEDARQALHRALELADPHVEVAMQDEDARKKLQLTIALCQQACDASGQEPDWTAFPEIRKHVGRIAAEAVVETSATGARQPLPCLGWGWRLRL